VPPFHIDNRDLSISRWPISVALGGPTLQRELGEFSSALPAANEVKAMQALTVYDSNPYDEDSDPYKFGQTPSHILDYIPFFV